MRERGGSGAGSMEIPESEFEGERRVRGWVRNRPSGCSNAFIQ